MTGVAVSPHFKKHFVCVVTYGTERPTVGGPGCGQALGERDEIEDGLRGRPPAGTVRANAVIAVQSFLNDGVIADISIAVDDASFVLVPAPASAALLGFGGLCATRRRR